MANAGRATAASEMQIAGQTDVIAGEQNTIAAGQDQLATQTQNVANSQATGDFISSALKGVAAVASLALAPVTGGASLAIGGGRSGGADRHRRALLMARAVHATDPVGAFTHPASASAFPNACLCDRN
jgi:hypothetical protein